MPLLQLIERANSWSSGLSRRSSVYFMYANATVSLSSMLSTYPGPLTLVTVQVCLAAIPRAWAVMPVTVTLTGRHHSRMLQLRWTLTECCATLNCLRKIWVLGFKVASKIIFKSIVQYPDPHFKTKHRKRRVVQPQVVEGLAHLMPPGGELLPTVFAVSLRQSSFILV